MIMGGWATWLLVGGLAALASDAMSGVLYYSDERNLAWR
jgi:hypothetical protein